jgi:hypothetical protein
VRYKAVVVVMALHLVFVAGCRVYTGEPLNWELEKHATLNSEAYGDLHLRLLHQRAGWEEPLTLEQILVVLESTLDAFVEEFGGFSPTELDQLRYTTVFVADGQSEQWYGLCWLTEETASYLDGCTLANGELFDYVGYAEPVTDSGYRPTQIAIVDHVYQRGFTDLGIYAHELMHTLLRVTMGDPDHDHNTPGAWEDGIVGRAIDIAFLKLRAP